MKRKCAGGLIKPAPPPWLSASASPAYGPVTSIKAFGLRALRALDPDAHLGPDAGIGEASTAGDVTVRLSAANRQIQAAHWSKQASRWNHLPGQLRAAA